MNQSALTANLMERFNEIFKSPSLELVEDHCMIEAGTKVERLHDYTAAGIEWCRCALMDGDQRRVVSIPASKLAVEKSGTG